MLLGDAVVGAAAAEGEAVAGPRVAVTGEIVEGSAVLGVKEGEAVGYDKDQAITSQV